MSSSAIRQKSRHVLKHLEGKYKLFLIPIALSILGDGVNFQISYQVINQTLTNPTALPVTNSSAFPRLLAILTYLFTLAAAYTLLNILRHKQQQVSYDDLGRVFTGRYLLHLFLLYIVRLLLLLPWMLLAVIPTFILILSTFWLMGNSGAINIGLVGLSTVLMLTGIIFFIIKNYAYSQAEMILFDRLENGHDLDPFTIIKESKQLMTGHKRELFILQLSFLGWHLLNLLTLGLLTIYLLPYTTTAEVIFYEQLAHQRQTEPLKADID